jgi:ABC-type glycerol-3-phosphate transport system substrate-binding protein
MGFGLGQNLDSPADALNLFVGSLDWRDPKYYEHWTKLEELWKAGYLNEDMNSIDLYPGIDLFGAGQGAMTSIALALEPKMAASLGSEKIGVMTFPVFGTGQMAGKAIIDSSGIGISSQSKNKEVAADFLTFLQSDERVRSIFTDVGSLPVNKKWDGSEITDPTTKTIWEGWVVGDGVAYISNLMPTLFWTDAMFVNSQKIVAGEYTGEQAGQNAADVTQKWVEQNPDLVEKYKIWANDLKL